MHRTVMLALSKPDALSSEVNGNGDVGNLTAPPSRALRLPYNQYKTFISRRVVIKVNYDTVAGIWVARGGVRLPLVALVDDSRSEERLTQSGR